MFCHNKENSVVTTVQYCVLYPAQSATSKFFTRKRRVTTVVHVPVLYRTEVLYNTVFGIAVSKSLHIYF